MVFIIFDDDKAAAEIQLLHEFPVDETFHGSRAGFEIKERARFIPFDPDNPVNTAFFHKTAFQFSLIKLNMESYPVRIIPVQRDLIKNVVILAKVFILRLLEQVTQFLGDFFIHQLLHLGRLRGGGLGFGRGFGSFGGGLWLFANNWSHFSTQRISDYFYFIIG